MKKLYFGMVILLLTACEAPDKTDGLLTVRSEEKIGSDPGTVASDSLAPFHQVCMLGDSLSHPGVPVATMEKSDFLKEGKLIIVDGKRMPEGYRADDLSREKIASLTVLKGEAAEKLYGKSAAAGVLLIQTCKK